jgi:hypothetical protein
MSDLEYRRFLYLPSKNGVALFTQERYESVF